MDYEQKLRDLCGYVSVSKRFLGSREDQNIQILERRRKNCPVCLVLVFDG